MALSVVRDLNELKEFIKDEKHYGDAQRYASEWNEFQQDHPEVAILKSYEEWVRWVQGESLDPNHPEHSVADLEIWRGNEIQKAFYLLSGQSEETQLPPQETADLSAAFQAAGLFALPFLRSEPELIEDHKVFKDVQKELMEKWKADHPGKDFNSEEGQDFLYGSLDDPNSITLKTRVMQKLEETSKNDPKLKKLLDRYAEQSKQTHEKHTDDPAVANRQKEIDRIAKKRFALLQKNGSTKTFEDVRTTTEDRIWTEFAHLYPQKAKAYARQNSKIKIAYNKRELLLMQERNKLQSDISARRVTRLNQLKQEQASFQSTSPTSALSQSSQSNNPPLSLSHKPLVSPPTPTRIMAVTQPQPFQNPSQIILRQRRNQNFGTTRTNFSNLLSKNRLTRRLVTKAGKLLMRSLAKNVAGVAARAALATTSEIWGPILIGAVVLLFIIAATAGIVSILFPGKGGSQHEEEAKAIPTPLPTLPPVPGLKIEKTGSSPPDCTTDCVASVNDEFAYTIKGSNPGADDVIISDAIPDHAEYITATGNPTEKKDDAQNPDKVTAVIWTVAKQSDSFSFNLTVRIKDNNVRIINDVSVNVKGGGSIPNDIATLFPNPLPPDPNNIEVKKSETLNAFNRFKDQLLQIYKDAASKTGLHWQVLAGIHYREGGAEPNRSLTSGIFIGQNEPDITRAEGCAGGTAGVDDGKPEPLPSGGCKFNSLLDSAIWAANHLKGKIGKAPQNYRDLVTALSRYNGGGNANCGNGVAYQGCPREFFGEDDPYALNFFDSKHKPMFVIYCTDKTRCNPPKEDPRPGTATVIKWVAASIN